MTEIFPIFWDPHSSVFPPMPLKSNWLQFNFGTIKTLHHYHGGMLESEIIWTDILRPWSFIFGSRVNSLLSPFKSHLQLNGHAWRIKLWGPRGREEALLSHSDCREAALIALILFKTTLTIWARACKRDPVFPRDKVIQNPSSGYW